MHCLLNIHLLLLLCQYLGHKIIGFALLKPTVGLNKRLVALLVVLRDPGAQLWKANYNTQGSHQFESLGFTFLSVKWALPSAPASIPFWRLHSILWPICIWIANRSLPSSEHADHLSTSATQSVTSSSTSFLAFSALEVNILHFCCLLLLLWPY